MCEWDGVFPAYGLASHKGYCTPKHIAALREFGPTPLHRQSFAPVWQNPVPQGVFEFLEEETTTPLPPRRSEQSHPLDTAEKTYMHTNVITKQSASMSEYIVLKD